MKRPVRLWNRVVVLLVVVPALGGLLAGCGSSGPEETVHPSDLLNDAGASGPGASSGNVTRAEMLEAAIRLIEDSAETPGGTSFSNAAGILDKYFEGTPDADFAMTPAAREFLRSELPHERFDAAMRDLESRKFDTPEARHIEDCLLYQAVAGRAAGQGGDLERVRRLFDWVVTQVALVPPAALAGGDPNFRAPARPYDVLLRSLAVERDEWAERSWVFITLCRQLGIDAGLLAYAPPGRERREPWAVAAIVDGKPYLFDARIGLPIPGPGGQGVATLEQAATDPAILARLDLPDSPYGTTAKDLAPGRVAVWIDSTFAYVAPRMRLLQRDLAGRNKMVLFRDPGAQAAAFREALGPYASQVVLWKLPTEVGIRLQTDGNFVLATQYTLQYFDAKTKLPLLQARMRQLRASDREKMERAMESFVRFRFADKLTMTVQTRPNAPPQQINVPPEVQKVLDLYATYFLALCHLDLGHADDARRLFEHALRMQPEAESSGRLYVPAFQYGARANLGRIYADAGDLAVAAHYLGQDDPTRQGHGNRLRARDLVLSRPFGPPAAPPAAAK